MGEEEVMTRKTYIPSSSKKPNNPSPMDLPARKKHDAVPPRLLNAHLLAQIIGTETIANVIIDAEACTLLDSGATTDLMTSAYAEAQGFNIRPITELSDQYMSLNLALGHSSTAMGYVEYNLQVKGISSYYSDRVALIAHEDTEFS